MAPDVGRSSPANRLSKVDLPEPELPSRARNSPARTSRETSLTARMMVSPSLYWREAFSALICVGASVWVGIVRSAHSNTCERDREFRLDARRVRRGRTLKQLEKYALVRCGCELHLFFRWCRQLHHLLA